MQRQRFCVSGVFKASIYKTTEKECDSTCHNHRVRTVSIHCLVPLNYLKFHIHSSSFSDSDVHRA